MMAEPGRIGPRTTEVLAKDGAELYLSAASAWEIAIKFRLGRVRLPQRPLLYVPERMAAAQILHLPISASTTTTPTPSTDSSSAKPRRNACGSSPQTPPLTGTASTRSTQRADRLKRGTTHGTIPTKYGRIIRMFRLPTRPLRSPAKRRPRWLTSYAVTPRPQRGFSLLLMTRPSRQRSQFRLRRS